MIDPNSSAEDALRRAHQTFHHLVEDNPQGMYVIDADMRMRYASRGSREVFKNVNPLIGQDFEKLMRTIWPEPFATEAIGHFRRTLDTGEPYIAPPLVERRADLKSTEAYDWSIYRIVLPDNRYGVVCYFYDATNRQRAEEASRQRETYFREMANAAPAMLWVTDANHSCTFLSQGWYDFTGQNAGEGLGFGWFDMIHADDREDTKELLMAAFRQHKSFSHDYRVKTSTGEYRWAIDSGRPKFSDDGAFEGFVGSVIDVHERRVAETELLQRASELEYNAGRLRVAAETTGFGTYDYDIESDVTVWSDQLYRIFQRTRDKTLFAADAVKFVYEHDRAKFRELMHNVVQPGGDEQFQHEFRVVRPSGEIRWVVDSGRVMFDQEGDARKPIRVIGTIQDITDRKIFEQSLQRAKRSAEAANRSRGEFLANMSHEIRTPMAAIIGHAEILKDHLQDPDNLQVVETIRRNGKFLLDIINDILDLSKIDAGKLEIETRPVRPDAVVAEVRSLMDVRASEKKLPLAIEFDGPIPETIDTDAIRLRQILVNLVGNAIKFTDEGEVKVICRYDNGTGSQHVKTDGGELEAHPMLIFEIIDTGIGIAPDKLNTLFEPFVQADTSATRSFGGTGLGLTICRRLARALGGDVTLESSPHRGSKFTLVISARSPGQLVEPNLILDISAETPAEDIRLDATILVVDDRRDIRYLAQHFIEKAGGHVVTATNGQEAIDMIYGDDPPPINLIVMDMQMPVKDGYAASTQLRQRGCKLPIIALTANAMKSDRDECLAAGCTDYTTKPLDSQKLIAMIHRLTQPDVFQDR